MIRVGLIGFGMAGRVFHAPLLSSVEGLELAAVVERSSNKAAERYPGITVYRSLEAMLADASLGLFVVATPNGTHFAIAKEILQAGKNVVVDKPMTLTSAEAAELIALSWKHKALLAPFHNRRWDRKKIPTAAERSSISGRTLPTRRWCSSANRMRSAPT